MLVTLQVRARASAVTEGRPPARLHTLIRGSARPELLLLEDFTWSFSSGHSQPLPQQQQHPPLSPSSGGSEAESRLSSKVQRGWTPRGYLLSQRGLLCAVVGALALGLHTPEVLGENTTPNRTSTGCHLPLQISEAKSSCGPCPARRSHACEPLHLLCPPGTDEMTDSPELRDLRISWSDPTDEETRGGGALRYSMGHSQM